MDSHGLGVSGSYDFEEDDARCTASTSSNRAADPINFNPMLASKQREETRRTMGAGGAPLPAPDSSAPSQVGRPNSALSMLQMPAQRADGPPLKKKSRPQRRTQPQALSTSPPENPRDRIHSFFTSSSRNSGSSGAPAGSTLQQPSARKAPRRPLQSSLDSTAAAAAAAAAAGDGASASPPPPPPLELPSALSGSDESSLNQFESVTTPPPTTHKVSGSGAVKPNYQPLPLPAQSPRAPKLAQQQYQQHRREHGSPRTGAAPASASRGPDRQRPAHAATATARKPGSLGHKSSSSNSSKTGSGSGSSSRRYSFGDNTCVGLRSGVADRSDGASSSANPYADDQGSCGSFADSDGGGGNGSGSSPYGASPHSGGAHPPGSVGSPLSLDGNSSQSLLLTNSMSALRVQSAVSSPCSSHHSFGLPPGGGNDRLPLLPPPPQGGAFEASFLRGVPASYDESAPSGNEATVEEEDEEDEEEEEEPWSSRTQFSDSSSLHGLSGVHQAPPSSSRAQHEGLERFNSLPSQSSIDESEMDPSAWMLGGGGSSSSSSGRVRGSHSRRHHDGAGFLGSGRLEGDTSEGLEGGNETDVTEEDYDDEDDNDIRSDGLRVKDNNATSTARALPMEQATAAPGSSAAASSGARAEGPVASRGGYSPTGMLSSQQRQRRSSRRAVDHHNPPPSSSSSHAYSHAHHGMPPHEPSRGNPTSTGGGGVFGGARFVELPDCNVNPFLPPDAPTGPPVVEHAGVASVGGLGKTPSLDGNDGVNQNGSSSSGLMNGVPGSSAKAGGGRVGGNGSVLGRSSSFIPSMDLPMTFPSSEAAGTPAPEEAYVGAPGGGGDSGSSSWLRSSGGLRGGPALSSAFAAVSQQQPPPTPSPSFGVGASSSLQQQPQATPLSSLAVPPPLLPVSTPRGFQTQQQESPWPQYRGFESATPFTANAPFSANAHAPDSAAAAVDPHGSSSSSSHAQGLRRPLAQHAKPKVGQLNFDSADSTEYLNLKLKSCQQGGGDNHNTALSRSGSFQTNALQSSSSSSSSASSSSGTGFALDRSPSFEISRKGLHQQGGETGRGSEGRATDGMVADGPTEADGPDGVGTAVLMDPGEMDDDGSGSRESFAMQRVSDNTFFGRRSQSESQEGVLGGGGRGSGLLRGLGGSGGGSAGLGGSGSTSRRQKLLVADGEIPSRKALEFEDLGELGRGEFGCVSCCRKRTDGVVYALKRQALDRMSPAARAVAKREVFALAALPDCPNLVRYYDAWYEDGGDLLFVQMEFLPGGTLRCLAETHRLNEASARRAVRDAARGLAYMHSKRIGHLDVKPENVLAASDGSFKLGDLGHATLLDSLTMTAEEGDRAYLLACMPDDFARDIDLASPPPGSLNGKSPRYPLPSMIDALLGQSPSSDCSTCGLGHGQGGMSSSAKKAESESNGMMSDGAALGEDDEEVPFSPTAFSRRLERAVRADSSDHNSTNNNAMDDSCASSEGQHEDGGAAAAAAAMAASSASASSPVASSSFDRGPVPPPTPMSASSARMSSGNPPHGAPAAPFSAPSSGGGRSVTAPDSGPFSEAKGPATAGRAASPPFFGQSPMPGGLGHGMTPQSCATTTNGTPFSDQSTNSAQSNTSGNNSTGLTQAFSPMGFDSVPFGSPPPAHLVQTQFPSSAPQPMPHAAEATTATTNTEGATAAASSGAVNMGAGDSADIHGSSMKPPPTPFHRAPSSHNRHDTSTGGVGIGSSGVSLVGQEWHSPPEGAYGYGLGPAADVDPQRAATNRAVYLCAADVFALGLCAYEVARMAEVPDGYIVPTNGNEYSDLREGAVPPFERQDMTVPGCCFGVAYENAVKDVLAPRSYQDRPTAQQLLDTFEALEHYAPITGEGASPANSPTTALSGGGAAALGSSSNSGNPANGHGLMVHPSEASLRMPPPQLPPGHSTPSLSELERLRARVRQLEAALAAAAGQGGGV